MADNDRANRGSASPGTEAAGVPSRSLPPTPESVAVKVAGVMHAQLAVVLTSTDAATLVLDWFAQRDELTRLREEVRGLTVYVDDLESALDKERGKR